MENLVGRIVLYRASDETVRPAIVVFDCGGDRVDLQVFLTGSKNVEGPPGIVLETSVVNGPGIGQWEGRPESPAPEQPDLQIENIAGTLLPVVSEPIIGYVLSFRGDSNMSPDDMKKMSKRFEDKFGLPCMIATGCESVAAIRK